MSVPPSVSTRPTGIPASVRPSVPDVIAPGAGAAERLRELLADCPPGPGGAIPDAPAKAIHLAACLQRRAGALQTREERRQQHELERMMRSAHDKATLMQMTDQGMRARSAQRAVDQLVHILDVQGVPRFFSGLDRALLRGFQSFGGYLPGVAIPMVREKMREESANVILPAEDEHLLPHLAARREAGLRMNVNLLGEALLGEEAAEARLEIYLEALQRDEVECISVKISTIYSQISPLAWEHTVAVLCDRLELLYREAVRCRFEGLDGIERPKFVYLDMEEYGDMRVTAEAFMRTLERAGLEDASAGIALQAYLPDAFAVQREINAWARRRAGAGGASVTVRLVKGANLEMERVTASVRGWPQAPFRSKLEVDANYRRMLHEGLREENVRAVRLGIATHNLFELAYAMVLAEERGALDRLQFEMLEGMANHQRRALAEIADDVLLYAPATRREHFVHAIGYLVRRLDENTGPDNFLGHAFKLEVGDEEWQRLAQQFLDAFALLEDLDAAPRRTQDRRVAPVEVAVSSLALEGFRNEPDTDFSLEQNVDWARAFIERQALRCDADAPEVPLVVAGEEVREGRATRECFDPSRPGTVVGRYRLADERDLERALACAVDDPSGWRAMSPERRAQVLGAVARRLRARRAELIGAAMAEGGKTVLESDPEVSEAIDFVEFYRRSALALATMTSLDARPRGVVAVVPPWNFPIAIPCGGVSAALAAGNCVVLKPASATVLVAHELCRCFWDAGVSREALQLLPCPGADVGAALVADPRVDAVVLTGGTATAEAMLEANPTMHLLAETGGKDATIVTAMADRDLAIKNVLHSAFSHSGQKCSATSLLVLEREVYEDESFKAALCDAVRSLPVGSAWDRRTRIGPLIRPPEDALEQALKVLEPGESWAVRPGRRDDNPNLWSPGVKWGVQPGSFTHTTELFGPVLGVMCARDLEHAIALVNQTGYGLTSGLESLDEREHALWRDGVRAGNLYINRVTTGAVVLRQPFGGMGKSAFGPGIKAGGPSYVAQLMDFADADPPSGSETLADPLLRGLDARLGRGEGENLSSTEIERVRRAFASYDRNVREEFAREHDHFKLLGQHNLRRYLPVSPLRIRVHGDDTPFELCARVGAARAAGCRITVSAAPGVDPPGLETLERLTETWGGAVEFVEETDAALVEAIAAGQIERLRYAAPERIPTQVLVAANARGVHVARAPVLSEGRIELLWYLREQSISHDYHRYGNLGEQGVEGRGEVV